MRRMRVHKRLSPRKKCPDALWSNHQNSRRSSTYAWVCAAVQTSGKDAAMVTDWETLWNVGNTPWDAGKAAPELELALRHGPLGAGTKRRALVVGSGSGWDALALHNHGYEVTALDLAKGAHSELAGRNIRRVTADFFTFKPASQFDLVWDYTFLCAIDPPMRTRWADRMSQLIAPSGELAALVFPQVERTESGPPYTLYPSHLVELLAPHGFRVSYDQPARESIPSREGRESLLVLSRSASST